MVENIEFYEAAAQVLPVLLLALLVELGLRDRDERETVGQSVWLLGVFGAIVVGETVVIAVLREREPPLAIADVVIILAVAYAVLALVFFPVRTRVRAVRAAIPRWLALLVEVAVTIGAPALVALAAFDVIGVDVLVTLMAVVALALIVVGRALTLVRRPTPPEGTE
jgi:hypothetical protein